MRKRFVSHETLPIFTDIYNLSVSTKSWDSLSLNAPSGKLKDRRSASMKSNSGKSISEKWNDGRTIN